MKPPDKNLVYLSLGSNIRPRQQYLAKSLELIQKRFPGQFCCSSLYQTRPFQNKLQDSYINAALHCETDLKPLEMLSVTAAIENEVGRRRSGEKWESRTIDIDILLWGDDIIKIPRLKIPHYDLNNRDFFLVPLLELNEHLVHPETGILLKETLISLPDEFRTYPEKMESFGRLVD